MKKAKWKYLINILIGITFIIYLLFLYYMTIGRAPAGVGINGGFYRYNLIPGKSIDEYINYLIDNSGMQNIAIMNLAGNLLLLFPMSCYLAYFIKSLRHFWKNILVVFIIAILIEIIQLFTGKGSLDIDDTILNTLGAMLGYVFWKSKPIQWIMKKIQI